MPNHLDQSRPVTKQEADIFNRFTYHPPLPELNQVARYNEIRDMGKNFAFTLIMQCPPSRELSLAIKHIEEAVMWANAAIARNERIENEERTDNG